MISVTDRMRQHHTLCLPHLATLRIVARAQAGAPLPPGTVREVAQATSAVVAAAKAAQDTALSTVAAGRGPQNASFMAARLNRLASAANDAVTAARVGNTAALRQQVLRFEALTSAMWTVQLSVCTPAGQTAGPQRAAKMDL